MYHQTKFIKEVGRAKDLSAPRYEHLVSVKTYNIKGTVFIYIYIYIYIYYSITYRGHAVAQVAGSIPDGVIGIFHWHNISGCTMALGLTRPSTEMSTRNISWEVKAAGA